MVAVGVRVGGGLLVWVGEGVAVEGAVVPVGIITSAGRFPAEQPVRQRRRTHTLRIRQMDFKGSSLGLVCLRVL
jgi:hypothetical protein